MEIQPQKTDPMGKFRVDVPAPSNEGAAAITAIFNGTGIYHAASSPPAIVIVSNTTKWLLLRLLILLRRHLKENNNNNNIFAKWWWSFDISITSAWQWIVYRLVLLTEKGNLNCMQKFSKSIWVWISHYKGNWRLQDNTDRLCHCLLLPIHYVFVKWWWRPCKIYTIKLSLYSHETLLLFSCFFLLLQGKFHGRKLSVYFHFIWQ